MFDKKDFYVIPSIRDIRELKHALDIESEYITLSETHIGNLKNLVNMCHEANKKVIVNMELVGGLSTDKIALTMLKKMYLVDVVIVSNSFKANMMKGIGIKTIQRVTLMDSRSLDTSLEMIENTKCEAIEIRPALYGLKYINTFKEKTSVPLILGGFIDDIRLIKEAKAAGFRAVTTSIKSLWGYK